MPDASGANIVSAITVDGVAQNFNVATYQGIVYATAVLAAGDHTIAVTYSAGGKILGQVTPAAAAASTTITVQSGMTTLTVQPATDGTYSLGPLPAGTYTVAPSALGYSFTPASQSITLAASNVTGVNFAGTTVPISETLFTSQTPASLDNSDSSTSNYELGTVFSSAVAGNITAIRFWKSPTETGAHTGTIWSATGQRLASVTFTGETGSGWQQQSLSSPLSIAAGTQYVVSVNTGATFYVATTAGLAAQITNQDLSSAVGNNGVFGSPGQFPTGTSNHANYFRDVVFTPAGSGSSGALIQGQVSPVPAAASAVIHVQGGSINQTVQTAADGTYSVGPLSAGAYSVSPVSSAFFFNPAAQTVTLGSSNVTGVNFAGTAPPGGGETLFTTQTPQSVDLSDGSTTNYELGMTFTSAVAGNVTGIRFWKSGRESGTHTGNIWNANGQLLASATFGNETPSGWQQQNLASPLAIAAGTRYVVSVNTGATYYVATGAGLALQITNQDLSSVVGSNGVFGTTGQFPANSHNNTNYFRDVAFTPGAGSSSAQIQGQISSSVAAPSTTVLVQNGSSTVTVQPASDGAYAAGPLTAGTYTVTPVSASYAFSPVSQSIMLGSANATGVNFTGTPAETLFTAQAPAVPNNTDGASINYELGTVFTSAVAGNVTAIRFWKANSETGTHTGSIWSTSGQLLGSVTFTNETSSGWQQQSLASPLPIVAGTQYVVSVNTGGSYYVVTGAGLVSQISNQHLSGVVGNNGLFGSPGQFPNNTYNHNNYFRDVLFTANP
jgi:hypothetical protein